MAGQEHDPQHGKISRPSGRPSATKLGSPLLSGLALGASHLHRLDSRSRAIERPSVRLDDRSTGGAGRRRRSTPPCAPGPPCAAGPNGSRQHLAISSPEGIVEALVAQ